MAKFFGSAQPVQGSPYTLTATDRLTFIKKVYTYFTFSLLLTAIGGWVGFRFIMTRMISDREYSFGGLFLGIVILEVVALLITYAVRKSEPFNKIMLAIYSFLSGMTLGPILTVAVFVALGSGSGAANLIIQAFLITAIVFVGLTIYVYTSKKDFSFMAGALFILLLIALGMGIMFLIFPASRGMTLVYSGFVALLFAGFMLYDTSMIMRKYTTDEYIAGAITLQLDFVVFFIHILRILIILSSSRD